MATVPFVGIRILKPWTSVVSGKFWTAPANEPPLKLSALSRGALRSPPLLDSAMSEPVRLIPEVGVKKSNVAIIHKKVMEKRKK